MIPVHLPCAFTADYDRLNNTNALIAGLWPSASEAVSQQLVQAVAPGLVQQAAKDYSAGYLTDLRLIEFELGEVRPQQLQSFSCCCDSQLPPRLDGMKVYDDHACTHMHAMSAAAAATAAAGGELGESSGPCYIC
jgi:hypothetical protein